MPQRTIQQRFLVPVLSVVVAALVIASGLNAIWLTQAARQRDEQHLARVVAALTVRGFPLTEAVLAKMRDLSDAEFVVLDTQGRVSATSLPSLRDSQQSRLALRPISAAPSGKPREFTHDGRSFLVESLPIQNAADDPASAATLLVLTSQRDWWSTAGPGAMAPLIAGAVASLALVVVITLSAQRMVRPIQHLGRQAARIAEGHFERLDTSADTAEIHDLARSLNQMAEKLTDYEAQVRRHERFRTLGQLSGGIAHQLRNAAAGARLALELHRRECPPDTDFEPLDVASRQLQLIETYLQRFLAFGRDSAQPPSPAARESVELGELLQGVCSLVAPMCRHAQIELQYERPERSFTVHADRASLEQLFVNLVTNAVEAVRHPDHSTRNVRIGLESLDDGQCSVQIFDSGLGPNSELQASLFEPFVSDKPDGTGLGLAVARATAAEHDGTIHWSRRDSQTCFEVRLPTASGELSPKPA